MYNKFNELALQSDKMESNELEICCFLNNKSPISDFNSIMDLVKEIHEYYTHVTVFLNVDDIISQDFQQLNTYCNNFISNIPSNVLIYYRGVPRQFVEYDLTLETIAFPVHLTLFNKKDIDDLLLLKIFTTALIFRIDDNNIDELLEGYKILYNKKWQADYATFKMKNKTTTLTNHMKNSLQNFLTEILSHEDYAWDDKKNCLIFNKETVILPLKAIRGIEKNIRQYQKISQCSFILRTKDGKLYQQENKQQEITLQDIKLNLHNPLTPLHFQSKKCQNCSLSLYCCNKTDNPLNPDRIDWFSCEEMKYWEFIETITKAIVKHEHIKGYFKA